MQDNKTIFFLPDRLNRKPPVVSGMTFTELMSVVGISAIIGLFLGLLVIFVFHITWAVVPTVMVIFALIGLKFGGTMIARLKRGKPETWLERYIAYRLNPSAFITKEQHWGIHRIYSTSKRKK